MDFVGRLWSDDVDEVNVLGQQVLGHDVGGLLLLIEFTTVGDDWRVGEVGGDVGGVIPRPEGLLIGWDFGDILGLKNVQELRGLGEAGTRVNGAPAVGIMGTELPDRGATHAETANEETVVVDGIGLTGVLIRFPEVNFTGELIGAAIAAVRMQDETVGRRNLAHALAAVL